METIIGLASLAVGLLLTTVSVKLAAGWLNAEHRGWGRALGVLLLSYLAVGVLSVLATLLGAAMPGPAGVAFVIAAVAAMIFVPILIFARLLGTTKWRATGIVIVAVLINLAISVALGMVLAVTLGVGLAGLGGLLALFGVTTTPDQDGGAAQQAAPRPGVQSGAVLLDRVAAEVEKLCACSDETCLDTVFPGLMDKLGVATDSAAVARDADDSARLEALIAQIDACAMLDTDDSAPASVVVDGAQMAIPAPSTGAPPAPASVEAEAVMPPPSSPAPDLQAHPAPIPAPARRAVSVQQKPQVYYVLRAVPLGELDRHLRKLVRLTLTDGRRVSDQLIAIENGAAVLKRDASSGSTLYPVKLADIERVEVFGR